MRISLSGNKNRNKAATTNKKSQSDFSYSVIVAFQKEKKNAKCWSTKHTTLYTDVILKSLCDFIVSLQIGFFNKEHKYIKILIKNIFTQL